jgi:hypothetical protein
VTDTTTLIEEVNRRDAWIFARRPGDLINLIALWKANGRLGTRVEQHEANVRAKLRDKPDRPDHGALSEDQARIGAERLALALVLTRTRTIRAPEEAFGSESAEGVLDPAAILSDWTPQQRQALLSRALFDPATYGRVRFHHRSVQEYLAAKRLGALRQTSMGMSAKSLHRLLFAKRYGMHLVIPSMQAIAAWLALWDDDVRREMMAREPETLLSMGDSESLLMSERAQLLRAFVKLYGTGGWRGLDIHPDGIQQFADPALGRVVRELWDTKPNSPDVTELLLEIIWRGAIEECSDIAHAAAFDTSQPDTQRVFAIRALVASGRTVSLHELRDSILSEPEKWQERVIHTVIKDLFPSVISVSQLMALVRRNHPPRNTRGGFSWAMQQIVEAIEPTAKVAIELRDALTDLIWQGRYEEQDPSRFRGYFDSIAPALARLCDRQIEGTNSSRPPDALIWACVVANRFGKDGYEPNKALKRHFGSSATLRVTAFWTELKLVSEIATTISGSAWRRFYHIHGSLIDPLTAGDRAWLLDSLHGSQHHENRLALLHALVSLWTSEGRDTGQLDELTAAVRDDVELTDVLRAWSTPPELDPTHEKWERKARRQELVREGRERQRLNRWIQWKEQLLANPDAAFAAEESQVTTDNIHGWLESLRGNDYAHYKAWNANALQSAFGEDIAARTAKALQEVWRTHPPTLKSQRVPCDRERILLVWCEGLTGLAAEAATPGWASYLTPDEAEIAAAYATIEFNGFPSWLRDVVEAHPTAIDDVIGGELTAELAQADGSSHLQTLQCLRRTDICTKRLLAPRLRASLPAWRTTFQEEDHMRRSAQHLEEVLGILDEVTEAQDRTDLAAECRRKLTGQLLAPLASAWLRGLFKFAPREGLQALEEALVALPEQNRTDFAVAVIAGLFGFHGLSLVFGDNAECAEILGRLVRCAYRYVHPAEGQEHESPYTPHVRDNAERAREFLLMALLDTPGAEAHKVVLDLAEDPIFAHFPDRLLLLERKRAARDAESPALITDEVVALERRFEAPPNDRDSLFACMVDRLDDLAHGLAHHDFTDRSTLRTIREELDMQRTLAWRLEYAANGAYKISREEEVADRKKPDFRLATTRGDQKAAIEVKIADKWTLTELEDALRDQLVVRYLRHDTCRAGCLLLTYHGEKEYWEQPTPRQRLSFSEVVEHLRSLAQAVERERDYEVLLHVCPLDLTDPL